MCIQCMHCIWQYINCAERLVELSLFSMHSSLPLSSSDVFQLTQNYSIFLFFCVIVDYISQRTLGILTSFKQMSLLMLKSNLHLHVYKHSTHKALLDIVMPVLSGCTSFPHQSSEWPGSPFASSRNALSTEMF